MVRGHRAVVRPERGWVRHGRGTVVARPAGTRRPPVVRNQVGRDPGAVARALALEQRCGTRGGSSALLGLAPGPPDFPDDWRVSARRARRMAGLSALECLGWARDSRV